MLDYLGMIPEAGIIFDGSNSIYYLAEGDYENAALAGLSAVPIVGEFATAERLVTRSEDNAGRFIQASKEMSDAMQGTVEYSNENVSAREIGEEILKGESEGGLEPGTLSNVDARKWYLEQEAKIPDLIDDSLPLEQQARQAFDLRNQYRMQARELMSDRQLAESLYATDPNLTWEQIIQKQIDKGLSGDDIYKAIIESSQRSRISVNQSLGLE